MKTLLKLSLLLSLATAGTTVVAQPAKKADEKPVPPARSVFDVPANPRDGHDPFFPDSTRGYVSNTATNAVTELSILTIKGFSGTVGNRMVIINNHTFAAGDDSEIVTTRGRIRVRCLIINANSVVIEANGQRRELPFSTQ
jgi:hypothetical protein